jgi:hypothetical protein
MQSRSNIQPRHPKFVTWTKNPVNRGAQGPWEVKKYEASEGLGWMSSFAEVIFAKVFISYKGS